MLSAADIDALAKAIEGFGATIDFLTPEGMPSVGLPSYPGIRLALPTPRKISFQRIAAAALPHADTLARRWLPDGKREGAEWTAIMQQSDICFAPVLRMSEALEHPHNRHRASFVEIDGIAQPAPAPRFLGTPSPMPRPPRRSGTDTDAVLPRWGPFSRSIWLRS